MDPLSLVPSRTSKKVNNSIIPTRTKDGPIKQTAEDISSHHARTKAAFEAKLGAKKDNTKPKSQYVSYKAKEDAPGFTKATATRIIRMEEMAVDPLEPSKFKFKKVPGAPGSPPPPVMRSPPRKLTKEDQKIWHIPPCVSNWKNQKGYVIPLDKRIAADGRGLQEVTINDKHAAFAEDLFIAERKAREEIQTRNELNRQKKLRAEEERERELQNMARQAREEGRRMEKDLGNDEELRARQEAVKAQRYETLRDHRLQKAGKRGRDEGRDISEVIALGQQVQPTARAGSEGMYDARLFNQDGGLGTGLTEEDSAAIYDSRLFANRMESGGVYKYDAKRLRQHAEELDNMGAEVSAEGQASGGGKSRAAFAGADSTGPRSGPVQFEKGE